ncbi:hypothetical protein B1L11_37370 [Microbispora sp. GKU 823]|nr:hypothetical protein B1L11_37370 [Microbispora sp. GKU 823]
MAGSLSRHSGASRLLLSRDIAGAGADVLSCGGHMATRWEELMEISGDGAGNRVARLAGGRDQVGRARRLVSPRSDAAIPGTTTACC